MKSFLFSFLAGTMGSLVGNIVYGLMIGQIHIF